MKKPAGPITAASAAFLNLLVAPGLGSLLAKRWYAGLGQLAMLAVGMTMLLIWLLKILGQYYGLMFGETHTESVGWYGKTGAILFCASWIWALLTSVSIFLEAGKKRLPPELIVAGSTKLDEAKIVSALATLPGWQRDGQVISRTFEFKDFLAAMRFVNAVAELAEAAQHHPDIDVRWNKVVLALTTHDAGGLTPKDLALARQCDALSVR
jgi:4a-hydroxytetrahydrobiopterin dehydratase